MANSDALAALRSENTRLIALLESHGMRGVITELAEDLYAFKDWAIGEYSDNEELNQRIWLKYPGF